MLKHGSVFGGAMLVAGTTIGGGMLALPVLTSLGGFVPSLFIYFSCWIFMACTGLLFLELGLAMKRESNIISMAGETLGFWGQVAAWGLYLFLFYCLTLAYIVGCGSLASELLGVVHWKGALIFLAIFAPMVLAGSRFISRVNVLLMIGLGGSFLAFVVLGLPSINLDLLKHADWKLSLTALPVAFAAFAYQGIIPTLVNYMDHDAGKTRKAILIGSFLPLCTYIVWQALILGIVPVYEAGGLADAIVHGDNAVQPLKQFLHNSWVYTIGQFFAFFALITSFFGVTLGLYDFLADGLHIKKAKGGALILLFLVFLPPLLLALNDPDIFLIALKYAGGIGCALLLGMLPILMVWALRYSKGIRSSYALPGGRITLVLLALFVVFELCCEIWI